MFRSAQRRIPIEPGRRAVATVALLSLSTLVPGSCGEVATPPILPATTLLGHWHFTSLEGHELVGVSSGQAVFRNDLTFTVAGSRRVEIGTLEDRWVDGTWGFVAERPVGDVLALFVDQASEAWNLEFGVGVAELFRPATGARIRLVRTAPD